MESFTKVLLPGCLDGYPVMTPGKPKYLSARVFVTVKYNATKCGVGELSLTGVTGPQSDGNARGDSGQIDLRAETFAVYYDGWDADKVAKLASIWDDWHLNCTRTYSAEMKAAGWDKLAGRKLAVHCYTQTLEAINASNAAKTHALAALRAGIPFTPAPEQTKVFAKPYEVKLYVDPADPRPAPPEGYQDPTSGAKFDHKTLGWLYPHEHPEGLLGRKLHPGDAHGYGSTWFREPVPAEVLSWLKALPSSTQPLPGAWAR